MTAKGHAGPKTVSRRHYLTWVKIMSINHLRRRKFFNMILQWLAKIVLRLVYRFEIEGSIDAPPGRGVLLIANHISFVDFLMIALVVPVSRVVFGVMDYDIYRKRLVNLICRNAAVIPITSKKISLEVREQAFAEIKAQLAAGQYVLFFPEGMVTHDGKLTSFQYGLERIKSENPDSFIVPITIIGLLGGFFSRVGGLFAKGKLFREFGRTVKLKIGPSIPATRWKLEHIETKVKLMLSSANSQMIESPYPIELPAIRESRRIPFAADGEQGPTQGKLMLGQTNDGFRLVFLDHSSTGFCIEIAQPLAKDAVVLINLEELGANYTCSVRWCQQQSPDRYRVGLKIINDQSHDRFLDLAGNF